MTPTQPRQAHRLHLRLAFLRQYFRLQVIWRGACVLAALVVGAALLACLADWVVDLPSLVRALLLVSILGAAGFIVYRYFLVQLARPCDDLSLALQIEAHYPELNDALASTVQFLQQPDGSPTAGSESMRNAAIQRTIQDAEKCDFNKILDRRGLMWVTLAAVATGFAAGYFLLLHTEFAGIAVARLADPFGNHTWTQIKVDDLPNQSMRKSDKEPIRIAQGQPFVIKGLVTGIVPENARLEVKGILNNEKTVPIKKGSLVAAVDMTQQRGTFKFRLLANDAAFPPGRDQWQEVEVLPPPKFASLNGLPSPQIELRFPEYTDLPSPARLSPGVNRIDAVAGTHVTFRAALDRSLDEAWIEFVPTNPSVRTAALLAPLGQSLPLDALGALGMGSAVWGRVPARLETDQTVALEFVPWVSGTYFLHVRDKLGLVKDFHGDLNVTIDPLPTVGLQRPATSISLLPDAEVSFKLLVNDEFFAIRSVYLEYRRKNAEHQWLDDGPQRLDIYNLQTLGKLLPRLAAGLAASPVAGPDLRLRPKTLEIASKWGLKNRFQEGEILVVQACADDFCDVYLTRIPGRSHEIEIRIVGKGEIAKIIDEGLGEAQQELVRLQQMQEEALNLIKELQEKKANNQVTQKELEKLADAEQKQKQIQERIGNRPDEGLRNELAKLQQLIKDNKLPASDEQDQIKTLKNELDRLAQEELPQLEHNLGEARKELNNPAKPAPKDKGPKEKGPLDKAAQLQQEAKKTLDELGKFLDPWATMNLVKGKTRDVLNKQKELQKDTAKIQDQKNELANKNDQAQDAKEKEALQKAGEELNADLAKKAEAQNALADKAQDLLKMMKAAQDKRTQDGDKDGAAKLKDAQKVANKAGLPQEMRDAAKTMPQQPGKAIQKQEENVKTLENMMAALEGRKDDDLDRFKKKQKNAADAREKVDKLAQDQERLQKKIKEAKDNAKNPDELAKELKKLAEEQEKLKDEAQKNARELARLQEEKAAKDLNRAAQEMDKAAQKLEGGEVPEDNLDEALNRLEDARANLQEFEEELAREQLAKIADRIKGLKERQDSALERSKELSKKVQDRKQWTGGMLETLGTDATSQEGLASETRSLKDKLKEAKVFEHVFEKAAKAMDDAAKAMAERQEVGKERRKALEPEELADESKRAGEVEKLQARASQRLQRLLDSLKNDPKDAAAKNDQPKKQDGGGDEGGGPPMRPGDGIPPLAQLKVLRAEQVEVKDRTKELDKIDPGNLTPAQRIELEELRCRSRPHSPPLRGNDRSPTRKETCRDPPLRHRPLGVRFHGGCPDCPGRAAQGQERCSRGQEGRAPEERGEPALRGAGAEGARSGRPGKRRPHQGDHRAACTRTWIPRKSGSARRTPARIPGKSRAISSRTSTS